MFIMNWRKLKVLFLDVGDYSYKNMRYVIKFVNINVV